MTRVLISASMRHKDKFPMLIEELARAGHEVIAPNTVGGFTKTQYIEDHLEKLRTADCLLVANYDDERGAGYIGPSAFFEAGWAYALGKPVYLLNHIADESVFGEDLSAIGCEVTNGEIDRIISDRMLED